MPAPALRQAPQPLPLSLPLLWLNWEILKQPWTPVSVRICSSLQILFQAQEGLSVLFSGHFPISFIFGYQPGLDTLAIGDDLQGKRDLLKVQNFHLSAFLCPHCVLLVV